MRGGLILNNFRFNLKGQLNEVKLPEYKALWPLFETIVSIHFSDTAFLFVCMNNRTNITRMFDFITVLVKPLTELFVFGTLP